MADEKVFTARFKVEDDGSIRELQDGALAPLVHQPVVDLVRKHKRAQTERDKRMFITIQVSGIKIHR